MKFRCVFALITALVFLCLLALPASAVSTTLTFRDMSLVGVQNFNVYAVNGSGTYDLGLYNSTTGALTLTSDPNVTTAYVLQFIPSQTDWISNPVLPITSFTDYATGHYPQLIITIFLLMLICLAVSLMWRRL